MGWGAPVRAHTWGHANEYADGTIVPNGEKMVAVLVPAGGTFGGFYDDGTLVSEADVFCSTNMVLEYLPGGDDPWDMVVSVNVSTADKNKQLFAFILDTRGGKVSAYGCIGSLVLTNPSSFSLSIPGYSTEAEHYVVVNTPTVRKGGAVEVPVPVLTGIVLDEAQGVVRLSVTNTVTEAVYRVLSTPDLREPFAVEIGVPAVSGAAAADAVLEMVVPLRATDSARFYKVQGTDE